MTFHTRLLATLFTLLLAAPLFAQQDQDVHARIESLEQLRIEATVAGDLGTLEQIFADDLIYTHSNGVVQSKQQFLEAIGSGEMSYLSFDPVGAPEIRVFEGAAVVSGTANLKARMKENEVTLRLRYTAVYVKQDDDWKMAASHSCGLPAK